MVEFSVSGVSVKAETKPDLFSPKALDQGTRLLLGCLPSVISTVMEKSQTDLSTSARDDNLRILDWGCGWGAITLLAAKFKPDATITAIDSDIAAVKATEQNSDLNNLINVVVMASHSYDELEASITFDIIASNPPTHRGREVVDTMIASAKDRLNPGGVLLLVVETRIKPWVARQMKATFNDYKIVKRGPKNVVLMATKTT